MATHMESAGMSDDQVRRVVERSRRAEIFVAETYGGDLLEPGNEWGDVELPDVGIVDVKSVPSPYATFVNGGRHRPVSLAVVVSEEPQLVLGLVPTDRWIDGLPPVARPQRCWHVLRADVFPPTGSWFRIGCVVPDWYALSDDEVLRADWRDRNRRRSERAHATPEPTPWADPETVKKGTGLARRAGHAPGKDNWRRRRPR